MEDKHQRNLRKHKKLLGAFLANPHENMMHVADERSPHNKHLVDGIHSLLSSIEMEPHHEYFRAKIVNSKSKKSRINHILRAHEMTGGSFFDSIKHFFSKVGHGIASVAQKALPYVEKIAPLVLKAL